MTTYSTAAGFAEFYCPELYKLLGNRHKSEIPSGETVPDGEGHLAWVFVWLRGDLHIEDDANGGVPKCMCGKRLIFVHGTDPGHER